MTWKKVILFCLLLCTTFVFVMNHLTAQRQQERIAAMQKQLLELKAKLDMIHLQEQINKNAGKAPVPVAKPSPAKPAASSTGD